VLAHVGWPTVGLAIVILIGRAIRDKDQTRRLIGLIVVLVAVVVGSVAICVELLGMQVPGFHVAAMTRAARPATVTLSRISPSHQRTRLPRPPRPRQITGAARPDVRECTLDSAAHVKPEPATGATRPWPSVESRRCTPTVPGAGRRPPICPWTPQHSGPQRHTVTHGGTEKKRPA